MADDGTSIAWRDYPMTVENTYIEPGAYKKPETSQEKYKRLRLEKRRARSIKNGKFKGMR